MKSRSCIFGNHFFHSYVNQSIVQLNSYKSILMHILFREFSCLSHCICLEDYFTCCGLVDGKKNKRNFEFTSYLK